MMGFSKTLGYAIKALACLERSGRDNNTKTEREIAGETGIPKAYLAKIIHYLALRGIVSTKRGPTGGASLTRSARHISVLEIVEAIEGDEWFNSCMLGMDDCSAYEFCPFSDFWAEICGRIERKLRETSLAEIIQFRRSAVYAIDYII
jgi:Rrf2 family protein